MKKVKVEDHTTPTYETQHNQRLFLTYRASHKTSGKNSVEPGDKYKV